MPTTYTNPNPPFPPGARPDDWQDDVPLPYRVLLGEVRGINGVDTDRVSVQPTAIQFSDGRVDDGSVHEPPTCTSATTPSPASKRASSPLC